MPCYSMFQMPVQNTGPVMLAGMKKTSISCFAYV
jgi:hypothetical protein